MPSFMDVGRLVYDGGLLAFDEDDDGLACWGSVVVSSNTPRAPLRNGLLHHAHLNSCPRLTSSYLFHLPQPPPKVTVDEIPPR